MKRVILTSLCVLFVTGTAQAALDIDGIYMFSCKDYLDGTPDTYPWVFGIWVDFADIGSLHHIDVSPPGGATPFTISEDFGDWEYESPAHYLTLGDLQDDYPTGSYTFNFRDSGNTLLRTVTLDYNGIDEPLNPIDFTYPSTNGQTGIDTNPTFTWTIDPYAGDVLGMRVWDPSTDKDVYGNIPVSMDTLNWTPGPLDPDHEYRLEVSVFNVKDGLPGPALPTMTVDGDEFEYALLIEHLNMIGFTTIPEPATLTVLAPNGGEVLTVGSIYPINWSSTGSISIVKIEYSTDNGSSWNDVRTVTNIGSYNWFVPAVNSGQCLVRISDTSDPNVNDTSDGVFTIDQTPPTISGISVTPTETECAITWNTDEPATSQVEYGLTDGYGSLTPLDSQLVIDHTVTIAGIEPDTTYHYRVISEDICGNETVSVDAIFLTLPDTTLPNTQFTSAPPENGTVCSQSVDFSWTGADDITPTVELLYSYQIDGQGWSSFSSTTSVSYPDLADGLHTFEVKAKDSVGNEDESPAVCHFTVDAFGSPPQISDINVTIGQQQATISWTTDKPATSQVEYGLTDSYGSMTPLQTQLVTNHTVIITGLIPDTTYHYRVKSMDACGREAFSVDRWFISLPVAPIIAPISDDLIIEHTPYVSAVPTLLQGTPLINWSLVSMPQAGMSIDPSTGVVSWNDPIAQPSPYIITVRATNEGGYDETSWQLTVVVPPTIDQIADHATAAGMPYTGPVPTLLPQTSTTWELIAGPEGMTINSNNGVVSWSDPVKSATPYTITIRAANLAGSDNETWLLTVMDLPIVAPMDDTTILEWTEYTSPVPTLLQGGDTEVSWSLVTLPAGMQIDSVTGQVTWSNVIPGTEPYTITIRATNPVGYDEESWLMTVLSSPVINSIGDEAIAAGVPYTKIPTLFRGTQPVTWELVTGPAEMSIDPNSGLVSWPNPVASPTLYTITIRATNNFGSDEETWQLSVQWAPDIQEIEDAAVDETTFYALNPVLIQGTEPISWTLVTGPSGMNINSATGELTWPKTVGATEPYTITVRASNAVGSDEETWQLSVPISYTASVSADIDVAPAGTPVTFTGEALWLENAEPAPNVDVSIRVRVQGTRREIIVHTDDGGEFSHVWQPLAAEAGIYTIGADHPALPEDPNHDQFTLLGMRAEPQRINHQILVGAIAEGTLVLRNLGDVALSGITPIVKNVPDNLIVDVFNWPEDLDSLAVGALEYSIEAIDASVQQSLVEVELTSAGGAIATMQLEVYVISPMPELVANPVSINLGMVRGQQTLTEFKVTNQGGAPTAQLDVLIPETPWMSLATPTSIPPIEPSGSASVVLALTPDELVPLGPYTGTVVVSGVQTGVVVPFSFNCISEGRGDLKIVAVDEFTYYAEGEPKVAEATVILSDPDTGEEITSGVTDPNGTILFSDITEAYYDVEVQADEHGGFKTTILAEAGQVTEVTAFLPRQLVTYEWTVEPTVIEDHYEFTVEAVFETHVPAPVVTIEPVLFDLGELDTEITQVDYTITNHGLITAEDVEMIFGNHPRYEFTPLVDEIGDLPAESSMVVPVVIRDKQWSGESTQVSDSNTIPLGSMAINALQDGCTVRMETFVGYHYVCGPDNRWHRVPFYFQLPVVDCPGSPPAGGSWGTGGGGGSVSGGGGGGWSPGQPYVTHQTHNTPITCNPCDLECFKSLAGCIPGVGCLLGLADCMINFDGSNPREGSRSTLRCLSALVGCLDEADPILGCLCSVLRDCVVCYRYGGPDTAPWVSCGIKDLLDEAIDIILPPSTSSVITGLGILGQESDGDTIGEYFEEQYYRVAAVPATLAYILGDAKWLDPGEAGTGIGELQAWLEAFDTFTSDQSDNGGKISETEWLSLLGIDYPAHLEVADVDEFLTRWNRSVEYWDQGILGEDDLPEGWDPNFIAFDKVQALHDFIVEAEEEVQADGFDGLVDAYNYALETLIAERSEATEGVCVTVRIQIDQEAVISRDAFTATLELSNDGDIHSLEEISVTVSIHGEEGTPSEHLFGIYPPELTGIDDINGSGILPAGQSARAQWLIVPTSEAAPAEPVQYYVRGELSYVFDGEPVTIPLFPAPITVLPNPSLQVKYFLEREVYSDDPFTEDIVEPAIPFSLGLMMTNTGAGSADNVHITSSQPKIIDNEKGLLIDFQIIGTRIGTNDISPSLTVNLGDIDPNKSVVAQWLMTSSLQGKFIEYEATYEHVDGLGDPRLSLIESLEIHEAEHVVRAEYPEDDTLPDFLTNDTPDINDLPDTLHLSDGSVIPVTCMLEAIVDGPVTDADLEVELTVPSVPEGWIYVRVHDPGNNNYQLVSVTRSDGQSIRVTENAWTTHRVIRKIGQDPYDENRLHLFDYDGPGVYTLTYVMLDTENPTVQDLAVSDVNVCGGTSHSFTVTFADDVAMDVLSLNSQDIRVTGPQNFEQLAKFVTVDALGNGTPRTATYRIDASNGRWNYADNGVYSIWMESDQVKDTSNNFVEGELLGTFTVDVEPVCDLELESYNLISSTRVGRTVFDYVFTVTLYNDSSIALSNIEFELFDTPLNMTILESDVTFADIGAGETTTSEGTLTVRIDRSMPTGLYGIPWRVTFESEKLIGDLTGDGRVNWKDLAKLAHQWLWTGPSGGIDEDILADGIVDFLDYAKLAESWMAGSE